MSTFQKRCQIIAKKLFRHMTRELSIQVDDDCILPDYWKKSASLNTFWIQNAQHLDEAFNLQLKLKADTQHTQQYAEILQQQIANVHKELHKQEISKIIQEKDSSNKSEIERTHSLHSQEIQRLQESFRLQKEDQQPYIQQLQNRLQEQLEHVNRLKIELSKLQATNEQLGQEVETTKALIPKKMTISDLGKLGEEDMEDTIREIIPCKVLDTHTHAKSADRHFIGLNDFEGLHLIGECKKRDESERGKINSPEIDSFLDCIKTHDAVNAALFLVISDNATIPYKCAKVTYEILQRENKPHLPVAWIVTLSRRTVQTAVLALVELQKQCKNLHENKHLSGKNQDVVKTYQEDMNKLKSHFPSLVAQLDSTREHSTKLCSQFQQMLTEEIEHKNDVQRQLESTQSLLDNIKWTRDIPQQDAWTIFMQKYNEKKIQDPTIQKLKLGDFSGNRRNIIYTAGIGKLNSRLTEHRKENETQSPDEVTDAEQRPKKRTKSKSDAT